MSNSPNPNSDVVCCLRCGKDTRSKLALCISCGGRNKTSISDQKDRPQRSTRLIGGGYIHEDRYDDSSDAEIYP